MKLTGKHVATLHALADTWEEFGYLSFDAIARRGPIERKDVRRAVRHLARNGLATYAKGLWSEDGSPGGAGYAITEAGRTALAAARQEGGEHG